LIITKVERLRGSRARYAIHIDGRRAFDLAEAIVLQQRLVSGDELAGEELRKLRSLDDEWKAREIAVNYLSYRPRSKREVADHLQKKQIPRMVARATVERLEQLGLLDDREFARMFVRDRLRGKRTGAALLRQQLATRGIAPNVIAEVLAQDVTEDDLREACRALAEKRLTRNASSFSRLEPPVRRQRLLEYLLRRGFSYDTVQQTIRTLLP